jgi:hypothetical protein
MTPFDDVLVLGKVSVETKGNNGLHSADPLTNDCSKNNTTDDPGC